MLTKKAIFILLLFALTACGSPGLPVVSTPTSVILPTLFPVEAETATFISRSTPTLTASATPTKIPPESVEGVDGFFFGKTYQVELNGLKQTILVHSTDLANPILLVLHGGPGYAMLPLMHQVNPELENHFTVVNWDQRGAGLSGSSRLSRLTLKELVADAHALTTWLKRKFGQKRIYILGHSFGTVIGLYLAKTYPDDYFAFVGVGQTVSVAKNEQYSYDWVLAQARARKDAEARWVLTEIGRPSKAGEYPGDVPEELADQFDDGFDTTSYYVGLFGGDLYGAENSDEVDDLILSSGTYKEKAWLQGWEFSQNLFSDPAVWKFDFMDPRQGFQSFEIPVYFFMGQHDYDTPVNLFEEYYATIKSSKTYIRFENSAHFPFYEEPEQFRNELIKIRESTLH